MMESDRKRDFNKAVYLQLALKESGYNLVCLDEFHIGVHKEKYIIGAKKVHFQ